MVKETNFAKLYKIMYKLTAIRYRHSLSFIVKNIEQYDDRQVFELMHAINTNVDVAQIMNPRLSSTQMRKIRLDQEFGKTLFNAQPQNNKDEQKLSLMR